MIESFAGAEAVLDEGFRTKVAKSTRRPSWKRRSSIARKVQNRSMTKVISTAPAAVPMSRNQKWHRLLRELDKVRVGQPFKVAVGVIGDHHQRLVIRFASVTAAEGSQAAKFGMIIYSNGGP